MLGEILNVFLATQSIAVMNYNKYTALRKEGYTIRGLHRMAREDGLSVSESVEMLKAVLGDEESYIIQFVDHYEYGHTICMMCQVKFEQKPDGWKNNCDRCQKYVDEMWEKVYDELGDEELSSEDMGKMFALVTLGAIAKTVEDDRNK